MIGNAWWELFEILRRPADHFEGNIALFSILVLPVGTDQGKITTGFDRLLLPCLIHQCAFALYNVYHWHFD